MHVPIVESPDVVTPISHPFLTFEQTWFEGAIWNWHRTALAAAKSIYDRSPQHQDSWLLCGNLKCLDLLVGAWTGTHAPAAWHLALAQILTPVFPNLMCSTFNRTSDSRLSTLKLRRDLV